MKATQLTFTCPKPSTPERRYKMKSFATVINSFKPLTLVAKLSTL